MKRVLFLFFIITFILTFSLNVHAKGTIDDVDINIIDYNSEINQYNWGELYQIFSFDEQTFVANAEQRIIGFNQNGEIEWSFEQYKALTIVKLENEEVIASVLKSTIPYLIKFDQNGEVIWEKKVDFLLTYFYISSKKTLYGVRGYFEVGDVYEINSENGEYTELDLNFTRDLLVTPSDDIYVSTVTNLFGSHVNVHSSYAVIDFKNQKTNGKSGTGLIVTGSYFSEENEMFILGKNSISKLNETGEVSQEFNVEFDEDYIFTHMLKKNNKYLLIGIIDNSDTDYVFDTLGLFILETDKDLSGINNQNQYYILDTDEAGMEFSRILPTHVSINNGNVIVFGSISYQVDDLQKYSYFSLSFSQKDTIFKNPIFYVLTVLVIGIGIGTFIFMKKKQ